MVRWWWRRARELALALVQHARRGVGAGEAHILVVSCWCSAEGGHSVSGVLEVVCWYVPGLVGGLWAAPPGDVAPPHRGRTSWRRGYNGADGRGVVTRHGDVVPKMGPWSQWWDHGLPWL